MKKLPELVKLPEDTQRYVIGTDNYREGEDEIFTFVIGYFCDNTTVFKILQSGKILNHVETLDQSPYEKYVKQLAEHYNSPITIKDGKKIRD